MRGVERAAGAPCWCALEYAGADVMPQGGGGGRGGDLRRGARVARRGECAR